MNRMATLVAAADAWKSMIVASLATDDPMFADLDKKNDFAPLFRDIRFLPYKKLRTSIASRALCLCGPDMLLCEPSENRDKINPAFPAGGAWPLIIQWLERVIETNDPFAIIANPPQTGSALPENLRYHPALTASMHEDALRVAGLTLFDGRPVNATADRAAVVIEPEIAGSAYTSFLFNLLVNRVARLAGKRIPALAGAAGIEQTRSDIEAWLSGELGACGVCGSGQVSVKPDGAALEISLDSEQTISGFPAKVSFTIDTVQ
jgi:hypothetical protein